MATFQTCYNPKLGGELLVIDDRTLGARVEQLMMEECIVPVGQIVLKDGFWIATFPKQEVWKIVKWLLKEGARRAGRKCLCN